MIKKRAKIQTVMGVTMPPVRLTGWAFGLGIFYVGMPFLSGLLLLDGLMYLLFKYGFDSCYGVLCLFS